MYVCIYIYILYVFIHDSLLCGVWQDFDPGAEAPISGCAACVGRRVDATHSSLRALLSSSLWSKAPEEHNHRLHCSSFWGLPYRILNRNYKKEP